MQSSNASSPFQQPPTPPVANPPDRPVEQTSPAIGSLHPLGEVVVIDDTPANLRLLASLLSDRGYQVRPFPSGKLALAGLERCHPDLILLDIQMPQMDGYEVCKTLKSHAATCDIPIIFISALNDTLDKVRAFSIGGIDYITKPFQAEEVFARVATHIELYRLRQQLKTENRQQAQQLAQQNQELQQINQTLKQQYELLQSTQLQLVQTEKMATLGNLLAGVAHEINNPLGFISCNLQMAQEHIHDLLELVSIYQEANLPLTPDLSEQIEDLDLDFIVQDLPQLLHSMHKGMQTIQDMSTSLRIFSRTENLQNKSDFDVHLGLDSTLMMLRYRLKANHQRPEIQVFKNYSEIPHIECYPGKLSQVFMNLLANAIDALDESNQDRSYQEIEAQPNWIKITTALLEAQTIQITIEDNGIGMSPSLQEKVCEQGFTTKPPGKGTGLGLAIVRQILEVEHGGALAIASQQGKGATFTIILPVLSTSQEVLPLTQQQTVLEIDMNQSR